MSARIRSTEIWDSARSRSASSFLGIAEDRNGVLVVALVFADGCDPSLGDLEDLHQVNFGPLFGQRERLGHGPQGGRARTNGHQITTIAEFATGAVCAGALDGHRQPGFIRRPRRDLIRHVLESQRETLVVRFTQRDFQTGIIGGGRLFGERLDAVQKTAQDIRTFSD